MKYNGPVGYVCVNTIHTIDSANGKLCDNFSV